MMRDDASGSLFNTPVAARLREVARLLALQEASPYRVAAYRRAADTIESLSGDDVAEQLHRGGVEALMALPGIDRALAGVIAELVRTGRLGLLDRLRGTSDAEALFRTLPGVGPKLAREIHDALQVDTLEALEAAARDGRLAALPGLGARRLAAIRASLAAALA
jgi:DNA polymerase (family X)